MNVIIPHPDAIVQVKVPLPFPLRWVNGYVIRGKDGCTVIDPGLRTPEAEQMWLRTFRELGLSPGDVEQIVLTHHHPDHYGLAGWMQQQTHAPVVMSRTAFQRAQLLWGDGQPLTAEIVRQFARHGMDEGTLGQVREHLDSFVPLVSPPPEATFLEPGASIRLGDECYTAILAEGHASGQLCFYDERRRVIFCGDQVLPRITPNVSLLPSDDANPLASFLSSLEQLSALTVDVAFPGHRDPFAAFGERARELIRHHDERLTYMRDLLKEPMTAYALCRRVFGDRLTVHQLRFAMAETLAHVIYLRERGMVTEGEREYAGHDERKQDERKYESEEQDHTGENASGRRTVLVYRAA
jgi:glyoxylase-like metal-dependent hydrolase (beta-lactamase superfamily II)